MFSKTAEYALRAVVAIARVQEDRPVLAKEISNHGHIPSKYLSKVLRDMVHAGVLTSSRGIGGGFRLKRKPNKVKLIEVIKPFDDVPSRSRCPLGHPRCTDDAPCAMHMQWKPVKDAFRNLLEETTVSDIAADEGDMILEKTKKGAR